MTAVSNRPKVSVCIASYNHAQYLPECLDSILAQTYQDLEIIIVDDGSTDGSHQILLDYQRRFPDKIHYDRHPGHINRGISITGNLVIRRTRGEYLAWIGSDDVWCPDKLEHQVALLDNDPNLGLVYSPVHFIDGSGQKLPGLFGVDISRDPDPVARMLDQCHVPAMAAVIRRECVENGELFDESLIYSDWELWVRILAHWRLGFVDRPLAMYRVHSHNASIGNKPQTDLQRVLAVMTALRQKATSIGGALANPRNRAKIELHIAYLFFALGDTARAEQSLDLAFEIDSSLSTNVEYFNEWLESNKAKYGQPASPFRVWAISQLISPARHHNRRLAQSQWGKAAFERYFVEEGIERGLKQTRPISDTEVFEEWPIGVKVPHAWKTLALRKIYPTLLFESQKVGDIRRVRHFWLKTVQYDPSWLRNRGVWSIGVDAFLGRRVAGWLRGLGRKARRVNFHRA